MGNGILDSSHPMKMKLGMDGLAGRMTLLVLGPKTCTLDGFSVEKESEMRWLEGVVDWARCKWALGDGKAQAMKIKLGMD